MPEIRNRCFRTSGSSKTGLEVTTCLKVRNWWLSQATLGFKTCSMQQTSFSGGSSGEEPACLCRRHRDKGSTPGSRRFPREGSGNPLQYSHLEKAMDRGAWWATVHGVAQSQTQLKRSSRKQQSRTALPLSPPAPSLPSTLDCILPCAPPPPSAPLPPLT